MSWLEECDLVPGKYYLVKDYMGNYGVLKYYGDDEFSCEVVGEGYIRYVLKEIDMTPLLEDVYDKNGKVVRW